MARPHQLGALRLAAAGALVFAPGPAHAVAARAVVAAEVSAGAQLHPRRHWVREGNNWHKLRSRGASNAA